jgi:hypothetical protein
MTKLSLGSATLDDLAHVQLQYLTAKLARARPTTLNEATLWSRAVYPLLEGVLAGVPGQPFLLVMEAKRGMGATDPRPALLAALLAVVWTKLGQPPQEGPVEVFGCFTVADLWTFVRAEAEVRPQGLAPRLALTLSWSREYAERTEADAILQALRWIARRFTP